MAERQFELPPDFVDHHPHGVELVPDDHHDDADSALSVPFRDSLTSLRSSILAYQQENGRTYHAMSAGKYMFPNDDAEVERLDMQHHIFKLTLGDKLCLSPVGNGAKRVLDLGTGSGIWSIEYADEHPESEVVGVDLSPVQPDLVPQNCSFEVDDLEKEWTWPKPFDLIFCRAMNGSFADNAAIAEKAFNQLAPGGYFEAQDLVMATSDDGTLRKDSDLQTYIDTLMRAMELAGRPLTAAKEWKGLLEAAGFEDVVETPFKWPTNTWPRDPRYKMLGKWCMYNMEQLLEPALLAPATRILGWTPEEAKLLADKAKKVLRDTSVHGYWPIYVVYGRKPLAKQEPAPTRAADATTTAEAGEPSKQTA